VCTTVPAVSKFPSNCRVTAEMDVRVTAGAAAGVLLWTGIGQAQAPAIISEPPAIVVHVEDMVGLRPHIMDSADKELVRIYAMAGVRAVWPNTLPVTIEDEVPSVTVRILDAAATERLLARSALDAKVLGAAVPGANRAYVFFPRVESVARFHDRQLGTLLGAAIAHEVGHLLLPTGAHSRVGIMRADLEVRSLRSTGLTRFTPSQAAEIVKTLRTWQRHSK
jgi:hypothetical protein